MALLAWTGIGVTLLRARQLALARLLAGQRASSSPRRSPGSSTTPSASATGSTSRAAPTPPRPSSCAPPRPALAAASRLAQSLGLAALFCQGRGDGRRRRRVGQSAARASACSAPHLGLARSRAAAPSPGRCCSGCRFPSTPTRWPTARCPSFCPVWWPHSWYNTRYGMELLPALALSAWASRRSFCIAAVREFKPHALTGAGSPHELCFILLAHCSQRRCKWSASARWSMSRAPRISRRAAHIELEIPPVLRALLATRPGSRILMNTSVYPELVALTGIPLRQTINESDLRIFTRRTGRARRPRRHRTGL